MMSEYAAKKGVSPKEVCAAFVASIRSRSESARSAAADKSVAPVRTIAPTALTAIIVVTTFFRT